MIEAALKKKIIPGANLKSELGCVDWRFLLSSLKINQILFLGIPKLSTLSDFLKVSKKIVIITTNHNKLIDFKKECNHENINDFKLILSNDLNNLPFNDYIFDLILFKSSSLVFYKNTFLDVFRILSLKGSILVETKNPISNLLFRTRLKIYEKKCSGILKNYWITPFNNEIRTVVQMGEKKIGLYFFSNILYGQSLKKKIASFLGYWGEYFRLSSYLYPRHIFLFQHEITIRNNNQLPQFLVSLYKKIDVELCNFKYGFSARGKYRSNKVIFFIFKNSKNLPEFVTKITRESIFNYRLENEYQMLSNLLEYKILKSGTFPEPLSLDYHMNLACLSEKAVQGKPFRDRTKASINCPVFLNAISLLSQLGVNSTRLDKTKNSDTISGLSILINDFINVYNPTKMQKDFLWEQFTALANNQKSLPSVFQHGDPGTWNMIVTENDKVILLDWESGESEGMPLWDIFYFFKTYVSWVSRVNLGYHTPIITSQYFIEKSDWVSFLRDYINQYCTQIQLDVCLVKPLFYFTWMHRALKESARLKQHQLKNGQYFNLLQIFIEKENSSGLKTLFFET